MVVADWIALAVIIVAAVLGLLLGFGKLLKFFTSGVFGFIISFVVVYFFLGVVSSWGFVQAIMAKQHAAMVGANNGFLNFLMKIGIEKILLAIEMFVVVQVIRLIIVLIIKGVVEIKSRPMRVINKLLGMLFMLGVVIIPTLIVFQIVAWAGGTPAVEFSNWLKGGFRLDWVFQHNPLRQLFEYKLG